MGAPQPPGPPPPEAEREPGVPLPRCPPDPAAAVAGTTMPKRKKQSQQPPPLQPQVPKREETGDAGGGGPVGEKREARLSAAGRARGAEGCGGGAPARGPRRASPGCSPEGVLVLEPWASARRLNLSKEGWGGEDKELACAAAGRQGEGPWRGCRLRRPG